jgi:hypothetical protein
MTKEIKCPTWLVERMERLKLQPPPTSEQVDIQMKASIRIRKAV